MTYDDSDDHGLRIVRIAYGSIPLCNVKIWKVGLYEWKKYSANHVKKILPFNCGICDVTENVSIT
jgi:hypothetical protein